MTVEELISKLKCYPKKMEVLIEHDFWIYEPDEFNVKKIAVDKTTGNFLEVESIEEYFTSEDIKHCLVIH